MPGEMDVRSFFSFPKEVKLDLKELYAKNKAYLDFKAEPRTVESTLSSVFGAVVSAAVKKALSTDEFKEYVEKVNTEEKEIASQVDEMKMWENHAKFVSIIKAGVEHDTSKYAKIDLMVPYVSFNFHGAVWCQNEETKKLRNSLSNALKTYEADRTFEHFESVIKAIQDIYAYKFEKLPFLDFKTEGKTKMDFIQYIAHLKDSDKKECARLFHNFTSETWRLVNLIPYLFRNAF